mmetsp:Transcript_31254/g.66073  ORF Transcript_31254/g.66073 Transcript_31254/m.66073 type:complete len:395 (+) Transcript_31254:75-1259(+)
MTMPEHPHLLSSLSQRRKPRIGVLALHIFATVILFFPRFSGIHRMLSTNAFVYNVGGLLLFGRSSIKFHEPNWHSTSYHLPLKSSMEDLSDYLSQITRSGKVDATISPDVVYRLKDLDLELNGASYAHSVLGITYKSKWNFPFNEEDGGFARYDDGREDWEKEAILSVSSIFPNDNPMYLSSTDQEIIVRWNITFPPPQSTWLWSLADAWPGVQSDPVTYQHLSGEATSFSWNRIGKLFQDAFQTGKLRVPLACIEGTTLMQLKLRQHERTNKSNDAILTTEGKDWELVRLVEETKLAKDLKQRTLQNRNCAWDLRHFLELMRKPADLAIEEWEQVVLERLPWESVPRMMNAMEIEPMDKDESNPTALVFFGFSAGLIGLLSSWMAFVIFGISF